MAALTETMMMAPMESVHMRLQPQPPPRARVPVLLIESTRGSNGKPKPKSTMRLDPVRILEPAKKKLSLLEAQRVMGALKDAISKAEIVVSLPLILQHLDEYRALFDDETLRVLEEHRDLLVGVRTQALEEMFCDSENRSSTRSESFSGDERNEASSLGDGEEREELDEEDAHTEKHTGEIQSREGKSSRSGKPRESSSEGNGVGRLTGTDGVSSGWQSRSYRDSQMEEQRGTDRHSEMGRQTVNSKSSRGVVSNFGEEEEIGEAGEEASFTFEGTIDGHSSKKEDAETSQIFERVTRDSVPPSTVLRSRSRVHMEIPPQRLSQMVESCRNVLRTFPVNQKPVVEVLKECENNWKEKSSDLIQHLRDLRDVLMAMLLVSPVEELERARYLREVLEKEHYNSEIVTKLSSELNAAENEKNEAIKKQNDIIRNLQSNLHSIEKSSEDNIRRMKLEAEKQEAADKKNTEGRLTKLQHDLTQVQAQYNNLKEEHRDKELALRRRKFQVETEVENWIQKFDMDMGERQDEYERIDLVYTEEKRQLNELEEKFKRLETEYLQIQEERQAAREKRDIAERELQMCIRAATTIQAFWRSFKVRKAIKAKKKKKGVKKGKK